MISVLSALWLQRSSRHLNIGIVLLYTMGLGLAPWYGAFMVRSHGMGTAELGLWLGLIFGVSGIVGMLLGGYVVGRWYSNNPRGQMRLSAILIALLVPCYVLFLLLPLRHQALLTLIPLMIVFSFIFGPTFALMQRLVANEMRATSLAVVMLLANLIGMGLGPQVVGVLSDIFEPFKGIDSLRYAMLSISFVALWSAYHFWRSGQTVADDLSVTAYSLPAAAEKYDKIVTENSGLK
jgi:sugar phosphate permease